MAAQNMAGFETYLRFDGGSNPKLRGESQSDGYQNWNDLYSFELGAQNNVNIGSISSGGGAGRASFKAFTITKKVNAASPGLFEHLTTGHQISSAEMVTVRSGGSTSSSGNPFYKVELGLVMVQDISWSGRDGDDVVEETVILQFGNGRVTYSKLDHTGTATSTVFAFWDIVTNTGESGSTGNPGGTPTAQPPTISGTSLKTVVQNTSSSFTFSITDPDTAISAVSSSATSLNTSLIPTSSLAIVGTGSTRTVNFTASNAVGTTTIRVSINDGSYTRTKNVTINIVAPNTAPEIISPAQFEVCGDSSSYLRGLAISDPDTQSNFTVTLGLTDGNSSPSSLLYITTTIPNGLTEGDVSGNGTNQVTLNASIDKINTTLSDRYGILFTPTDSSTLSLQIEVNDNDALNSLTDSLAVTILPILSRYEFWERENFTEAERLNNANDPLGDFENDSNINLLEFAFNLDPKGNDILSSQVEIIEEQGSRYMEITFPIRNNATSLNYEIQRYFEATKEWKSDGFVTAEVGTRTQINPEFETITQRLLDPVEVNTSALIRILVSLDE